ncbi:phospholipase D family protein [Gordonia sp. NB41Y]|nr:phospholipase D family protein [Gordonia sp. NB41Y]WLP90771.1 phospholipase D family protein [Gordonia sp. NB41Y]
MRMLDTLGLTSERTVSLVTDSVWESLTPVLQKWPGHVTAAVAYVGYTGDVQLPLTSGSTLIVDASEHAVDAHMTNPHTLLRWYRAGVSIYSLPHLHAKMILAQSDSGPEPFLVVGSADATQHSASILHEAALVTDSTELVEQARATFAGWKTSATKLGSAALTRLCARYDGTTVPVEADSANTDTTNGDVSTAVTEVDGTTEADDIAETMDTDVTRPASSEVSSADTGSADVASTGDDAIDVDPVRASSTADDPSDAGRIAYQRPQRVYLAAVRANTDIPDDAIDHAEALALELGVEEGSGLTVEVFRQNVDSGLEPLYSEGVHIVPIHTTTKRGNPSSKSVLGTPGRVIGRWIDSDPDTRYYFILRQTSSEVVLYADAKYALREGGVTAELDMGYLRRSVIDALVGLWTGLTWTTS